METPGDVLGRVVQLTSQQERRPLANVLVYLQGKAPDGKSASSSPLKIRIAPGEVIPRHSCALVGQQVIIAHTQSGNHAIVLRWPNKPEFGEIQPPPEVVKETFTDPIELATIYCLADSRVKGYLTVVPNNVYAWSDSKGEFKLPRKLPPGTYTLTACHPELGFRDQKETIPEEPAEPAQRVTFTYDPE